MQNYCIRYIILYNRLDVSFHLLESSCYKRAKSAIAFLQTGIKFIFSYASLPYLYLTHMLSDQNELLHCTWFTKIFIHPFIHSFIHSSWDKIFALFRNTKCFSLQKLIFNWCRCSLTCSYIVINIVVKCILSFVDIVIHSVIDVRFCYFIFVNKKSLMFITDINRIKSPVVDLLLKLLLRFVLTVFQVSCMLLLAILFPLKSSFDDNVYLTT